VNELWATLSDSGKEMMPLGEYPFSERYAWVEDKYGLSWQIMYRGTREIGQRITPTLMFTGEGCGKTEEAITFYTSAFRDSAVKNVERYGPDAAPNTEEMVKHAAFRLEGQGFAAMDSAYPHGFTFNEAISLMVRCDTQDQVDYYWNRLSAHPEAEQCGWLKDKYGLSWQIVPRILDDLLNEKNPERLARITEAFMRMKKFDIEELKLAAR
jgi:predicted 3-demethylubiquinone-9 3-methyltransferase (glyoxalase superfamily)